MSSKYFKRTSLHLVRLKIFEWIKCLRRHLHQIQGNWAGRNFVTESRVNSRLITHARMHTEMNLKSTTTNGSTFEYTLMGSWEVRLTWLDCNQRSYIWSFGWTLRKDVRLACTQTPELFFDLLVAFQLSAKGQKINLCKWRLTTAIHRRLLSRFFSEGGGTSVHRLGWGLRVCPRVKDANSRVRIT